MFQPTRPFVWWSAVAMRRVGFVVSAIASEQIGSTAAAAEATARVVAVEIDAGMVSVLGETLAGLGNVEVVQADFLSLDLPSFLAERLDRGRKAVVIANLPYTLSTPVLMRTISSIRGRFSAAVK